MEQKNKAERSPAARNDGRGKVTSYDVASLAGVSQSAVSRCFKPGASISAKIRGKVEKAARQLGYQPNAIARGLISGRSNIVAVIINNLTNLIYPEVLSELNQKFAQHGQHVLLFTLSRESDVDRVLDQVWQYQVDGIVAAAQFTDAQLAACEARRTPLVFYNRVYPNHSVASVCCDHEEGERLLVEGLLRSGRESFAVVSGPADSAVSTARTHGAINALKSAGIPYRQIEGDYSYECAKDIVNSLLAKDSRKINAIVCSNDVMAIGCIDQLVHVHGMRVPEDISVVGFDGVSAASWENYNLTTIVQPVSRMVDAAVQMLIERIESFDLPVEKRIFSGKMRFGASASLR